ncbi:hypothetical protein R1flu_008249 [Riccia fluitans]|uniref:Uncharacterized protein n=1 Tax=Riccia fluitans TaxID=41844 RepID=A0ABD1YES7_9MARC
MAIHPIVPSWLPRPPTVGFEELSLLTRDEVFLHLKFDCLKTEGILFIDGNLFARGAVGPQGQLPVNVSREGLKEYLDFPGNEDSSRVVSSSVIEAEFLNRIGHKSLKDAWTIVACWFNYRNTQPRNEMWFIDDLGSLLLLGWTNEDRASTAKFWEGWQAIVQLLCTKFLAQMMRQNQEGPLLLGDEQRNAFGDTQAQWDAERCKLVCERDRLKKNLLKVQDVLVDVEQWKEAL